MTRGIALVRRPTRRLAEGLVTHIERSDVDLARARRQHEAYRAALAEAGWRVREVAPAEHCPDSVFVEDTVVVCDGLAVITRPGAPQRRPEIPGTLDGGDVLQVGTTVYVGRGGRTNGEGVAQLRADLATRGRRVIPVPLRDVLHLKSAVTALPDGTLLALPELLDAAALRQPVRAVDEEAGCHVVPLGDDLVLIAASAPRTAALVADLGFTPVVVDISEYEKLEGCVTCLSVLIPGV